MDKEIQKAFYDGVHEVYSIMFTDGIDDGINLYMLDEGNETFYRESKFKTYKTPILLVAKSVSSMQERSDALADLDYSDSQTFTVTHKSLDEKGIPCATEEDFRELRKAYIEFHGSYFKLKKVQPRIFVENMYMAFDFVCDLDVNVHGLSVISTLDMFENNYFVNVFETLNEGILK